MDPELQVEEETEHRLEEFTKVVVGAAVGYIAGKLTQDAVGKLFAWKRAR